MFKHFHPSPPTMDLKLTNSGTRFEIAGVGLLRRSNTIVTSIARSRLRACAGPAHFPITTIGRTIRPVSPFGVHTVNNSCEKWYCVTILLADFYRNFISILKSCYHKY